MKSNKVIYIMGVSGVGKSTIGLLLAKELGIPFFDGDDFHSKENIVKMSQGIPLNDQDRAEWLKTLNQLAKDQLGQSGCIIACSALKQKYREILNIGIEKQVTWVYLKGAFKQIKKRLDARTNHYMSSKLLESQFDILQEPDHALTIDVSLTPQNIIDLLKKELSKGSEFGIFGLGVMGRSLARNMAKKGFKISMYNRHVAGSEEDIALNFKSRYQELSEALPFDDLKSFVDSLKRPRRIMLMVNAGKIVDYILEDLLPLLSEGDIVIDGGNSYFKDTKNRSEYLKTKGIHFIGVGVSGGEEGALNGPSLMPGGDWDAYKGIQHFLETTAAKDSHMRPCCAYVGPDGSGHFVKMVHNGIEYVEMQLLAEVCAVLKAMRKNPDEIAAILESWKPKVNSYLLEITIAIHKKKEGNDWLVNKIMDKAGNKGTGNWATITTAELGVPSTLLASALFARYTSFFKDERIEASTNFSPTSTKPLHVDNVAILNAYQYARILNHYQGFKLISEAGKAYQWNLNLSELARIWTNGCIIRSDLMDDLVSVFKQSTTMLTHPDIITAIRNLRPNAAQVVSECILAGLPIPCLSESLIFLNAYSTASSSANIIQAQRDFFGAHTYQRTDDSSGKFHHTNWK